MADISRRSFRPRAGLVVSVVVALAAGACQGFCDGDTSEPVEPDIASIRIVPDTSSSTIGVPVNLRVEAVDIHGNHVWLEDLPGAKVDWVGVPGYAPGSAPSPAGFAFDSPTGAQTGVVVKVPAILFVDVTVHFAWEKFLLTAVGRVNFAPPAGEDRVVGIASADPLVAMLDGCVTMSASPTPVHAMLGEFSGTWKLPSNLTENGCSRPTEFALFSKDHRMTFRDATLLNGPPRQTIWTDALGDALRSDTIAWGSPDQIDLYIYYFLPGEASVEAKAEAKVNEANDIFSKNRLGIEFVPIHMSQSSTAQVGACPRNYVSATMGIDLKPVRLNVAFVKTTSPANVGIACPPSTAGEGRIIVIDWDLMSHETVAHEIGHSLGHERKNLGFYHVKSGSTPGFAATNLMHEKTTAGSREWLTIGQVFRMNVDTGSWYQHATGIQGRHPAKACGCEPYEKQVCPRLDRQPAMVPQPAATNYCGPST